MDWKKLLAYITGSVDQELLLRNEYLVTENRILLSRYLIHDHAGKFCPAFPLFGTPWCPKTRSNPQVAANGAKELTPVCLDRH